MKNTIFYASLKWWFALFTFLMVTAFLFVGVYYGVFIEHWYVLESVPNSELLNFDALISFLSVQVNIMTLVYLLFYLIKFNKSNNIFIMDSMQRIVVNWNFLDFIIFWIGIVGVLVLGEAMGVGGVDIFTQYSPMQITCTVITHFFCPLFMFVLYFIDCGIKKHGYLHTFKEKEIYLTVLYPFIYLVYVIFRAQLYKDNQGNVWPYPFIDFSKPLVDVSPILYFFLIIIIFGFWLYANHCLLLLVNNLTFKRKTKYADSFYKKEKDKKTTLWKLKE